MEFIELTVRFESRKEQEIVEKTVPLAVYEHETEDNGRTKPWTTFDITGCEPHDISEMFGDPQLLDEIDD